MNQRTPMWKLILILNLIVYSLELFLFKESDFLYFCLNVKDIHLHQFITHQFLHISRNHLFSNMVGLFLFGPLVENFLGRRKFLISYLFCGVIGSFFQIFYIQNTLLGASGAIFGLIGLYLIFSNKIVKTKLDYLLFFFGSSLILLELPKVILNVKDNVGHWAHLGGVVGSIIIFLFLKYGRSSKMEV
jgi:membrane associated rhomboid family serine protease